MELQTGDLVEVLITHHSDILPGTVGKLQHLMTSDGGIAVEFTGKMWRDGHGKHTGLDTRVCFIADGGWRPYLNGHEIGRPEADARVSQPES